MKLFAIAALIVVSAAALSGCIIVDRSGSHFTSTQN